MQPTDSTSRNRRSKVRQLTQHAGRWLMIPTLLALAGVAVLVAAFAITVQAAPTALKGEPRVQGPGEEIATPVWLGINELVTASDAAIVGHVLGVSAPRWNSKDGQRWPQQAGTLAQPVQYREANIVVDEVLFASATLPLNVEQSVQVQLAGDGTATGAVYEGVVPVIRYNQISGPLTTGDKALLLLQKARLVMQGGEFTSVVVITNAFHGNWRLTSDGMATSADTRRSVPYGALRDRILIERKAGNRHLSQPESLRTSVNPIADKPAVTSVSR